MGKAIHALIPKNYTTAVFTLSRSGVSVCGHERSMSLRAIPQRNLKRKKLERVRKTGQAGCLDLFSGCGGMSLGFYTAGFDLVGAVELDPLAARSHAINFFRDEPENIIDLHAQPRDITLEEPEDLIAEFGGTGQPKEAVDIIVGGPPCQAFARVGRAKLREVAEHPTAFKLDPRADLYLRYLHYVEQLQPLALLMENVPDILNYGGHNIAEEICEVLEDLGYDCAYTLLNAAYYGVPQMRERLFLIAYAKELKAAVSFPRPTHWIQLPKGYEGSRQVALKALEINLFHQEHFYVDPPESHAQLLPAVTAQEALGDLPPITIHLSGELKRGARRFDAVTPYSKRGRLSPYASLMRNWPGFENQEGVSDHVIRSLPRDYAIFRRMNPGDQYPEAHQHALAMLNETIAQVAAGGKPVRPGSETYQRLMKQIVPPYDPGKFPNKWRKMEADLPARTLMAHLGKDGYSHIHYDSEQARTISVREAARLQSFPDGFIFAGTMNPAFRQIGNAVPPLLAKAIAEEMMRAIRGEQ
jgi:DNA (cytosine-5)-methyltransferase 1